MLSESVQISVSLKMKETGKHAIIFGIGSITQSAAQFFLIPILTATLAPDQLGVYYLIQMASTIAGSIFYFGMTSALPRSYFDYSDESDRRSVFTTAFIILLIGATFQIVIGIVFGGLISRILLRTNVYKTVVIWAFIGSAFSFINQFFFSYLRFLRRSVFSVVLGLLSLIGSMGISIVLLKIDPSDISAPFKGLAFAQLCVAVGFLANNGQKAFSARLMRSEFRILTQFGIPTVLSSLALITMDWADRVIIERTLSMVDVGIYSVGYKLSSVINIILIVPFGQIFSPMMIEYREHTDIKLFYSKILSYYLLTGGFLVIVTSLFVNDILPFIARSSAYFLITPVIVIVMIGYVFYGTVNIFSAGFVYSRKIIFSTIIYFLFAVLKLSINMIIIPKFGLMGAAFTTLTIYCALPLGICIIAFRYFYFSIEWIRIGKFAAFCFGPIIYSVCFQPTYPTSIFTRIVALLLFTLFTFRFCLEIEERNFIKKHLVFNMKKG